jgi:spore germination protein GerM
MLAACGIPTDTEPRAIPRENLPSGVIDSTTTTATPSGLTAPADVYLMMPTDEGRPRLVRVERESPIERESSSPTPAAVLEVLLAAAPTPSEEERGITNAIPTGTRLASPPELESGVLRVDLTERIYDSQGDTQLAAFGQIVCTADALDEVEAVRFAVGGEDIAATDGGGATTNASLTCDDYDNLLADPG